MAHDPTSKRIEEALTENATTAESISTAAGSAKSHSIPDQILAADRAAVIAARRRGRLGSMPFPIQSEGPR